MEANKEQLQAINSNDRTILCLAGAGAGKTYCLVNRMKRLAESGTNPKRILALTFTNAAAHEMLERFHKISKTTAPEVRTFHGFCYSLIVKDIDLRRAVGYSTIPNIATDAEIKEIKTRVNELLPNKVPKDVLEGKRLPTAKELVFLEMFNKRFAKEMKLANLITFDYMCEEVCKLFKEKKAVVQKYFDYYKHILVDEFQDTDTTQFEFVSSFPETTSMFLVGDAYQCQPAGTKVMTQYNEYTNIEDLKVGDTVVSYSPRNAYYRGASRLRHILAVEHHTASDVVTVHTANQASSYTLEHITYVRIHFEGNEDKRVVYLMHNSNKGWWRIGECALFLQKNNSDFGLRHRMQEEKATEGWILAVVDKGKDESFFLEQLTAAKYGIPDVTWQTANVKWASNGTLDRFYQEIPDIDDRAVQCLKAFGKRVEYPFFRSNELYKHFSKQHMFECNVCNLFPYFMDVVVPCPNLESWDARNGNIPKWHNCYEQILSIEQITDPCEVYSLEVEEDHNYIADGILTHNCIYQFRNCTNEYVKLLSAAPGWTVIKLPNNYRSTKQICQYANKFSCRYGSTEYRVEMIGHKDGPEVCLRTEDVGWEGYSDANTVRYILSKLPEMEGTTAILVRSNKEVAEYTQLLRSGGIELGSSAKDDTVDLLKCINDDEYFLEYVVSSCLDANQYSTYMKMTLADSAPMTISTLENLFKEARKMKSTIKKVAECRRALALLSTPEAVAKIEGILKTKFNVNKEVVPDDKKLAVEYLIEASLKKVESLVYVGTIHSAKGLEYDNVFIPGVGSKSFKLDSEEQKNIFYVGITRAKTNLTVFTN